MPKDNLGVCPLFSSHSGKSQAYILFLVHFNMYEADNEWYSHPDFLGRGGFRSANTDIIFECNVWFCVIREIQSDIKIEYF